MTTLLKRWFIGETAVEILQRELRKYVSREAARIIIYTQISSLYKLRFEY